MEIFLKNELQVKEEENKKRTELIKNIQVEVSNKNFDLVQIKKDNLALKSKLDIFENEINESKFDDEINNKNNDIFVLEEKNSHLLNTLEEFKEWLKRKDNCISLKKSANYVLVEIIKSKRNEVKCVEAMQVVNSDRMKENLSMIRQKETELLKKLV